MIIQLEFKVDHYRSCYSLGEIISETNGLKLRYLVNFHFHSIRKTCGVIAPAETIASISY